MIVDPHSAQTNGAFYRDLTSHFPIRSNHGSNYILVLYNYDSNSILVEPLKNHSVQKFYDPTANYMSTSLHVASHHSFTLWTMKHPPCSNPTSPPNILSTNSYPHTSIIGMLPKEPFTHSKITSLLAWLVLTSTHPSPAGVVSYHRPNSP